MKIKIIEQGSCLYDGLTKSIIPAYFLYEDALGTEVSCSIGSMIIEPEVVVGRIVGVISEICLKCATNSQYCPKIYVVGKILNIKVIEF